MPASLLVKDYRRQILSTVQQAQHPHFSIVLQIEQQVI